MNKDVAAKVYQELREGEDFAKLAEAYSAGYRKRSRGKSKWLPYETLPSDVEPLVRAGEVIEPVDTGQGI